MPETVARYDPERGALVSCQDPAGTLLAADSWLVDEGRVRALDLHFGRFAAAARPQLPHARFEGFFAAVTEALGRAVGGRTFPRIELRAHPGAQSAGRPAPDAELYLRIRKAPAVSRSATLWVYEGPDPRRFPRIKGPDLEVLGRVREHVRRVAGADEALLLGHDGEVLEGAYSSLLWWRDGRLHLPAPDAAVLPGVTRELVLRLARREQVAIMREPAAAPAELDGAEVWITSALHGIRGVHGRIAPGVHAADPERAAAWQQRLDEIGGCEEEAGRAGTRSKTLQFGGNVPRPAPLLQDEGASGRG